VLEAARVRVLRWYWDTARSAGDALAPDWAGREIKPDTSDIEPLTFARDNSDAAGSRCASWRPCSPTSLGERARRRRRLRAAAAGRCCDVRVAVSDLDVVAGCASMNLPPPSNAPESP
jgi:hypothetical protein